MSDVTRYDAVSDYEGGYLIVPADEGEYVTFEAFRAEVERLNSLMVRVYNAGYRAGHHDTVEGQYAEIHRSDMDTYHKEDVAEILKDQSDE
jgi:hypothetical protein